MSKFVINPDVQIVKSCPPAQVSVTVDEQSLCPSLSLIEDENFLENVEEDILFVDDSIKIKIMEPVGSSMENINEPLGSSEALSEETEKHVNFFEPELDLKQKSAPCFDAPPIDLSLQVSLPLQDLEPLFFYEILMISKKTDSDIFSVGKKETSLIPKPEEIEEVGSTCVMVEGLDDGNIMVYVSTFMNNDDKNITHETLSVVNHNLQTIHEKIMKRSYVEGHLTEKTLHIFPDYNRRFKMIKTETKDDETVQWKGDVEWNQPGDYLSIGANILLTRRMILDRFEGCVQSWNCDVDGEFSLSQHWFLQPENMEVIDGPLEVQRVNRLLISHNENISRHSSFFLSSKGCLLKEVYSKTLFRVHLNPFSELPPKIYIKDLPLNWKSDIQLMSLYLEFKEKRKEEMKQQLEHPPIRNILCDYIFGLVKSKPKNVMDFTVNYVRKLERDGNVQVYQTAGRRHQQNSI